MFDVVAFLFEILAVFLGVFAAFWLENYRERKSEKSEAIRALRVLRQELEENLIVMEALQRGFSESMKVPYFGPQFALWHGISNKLGLVEDDTLLRELAQTYSSLELLDQILIRFIETYTGLGTETDAEVFKRLNQLVEMHRSRAQQLLTEVIPRTRSLIARLEEEMKRLN